MTIDKTINEVKELQEKDSLTLNEIDNNVKKILKFGTGGAVDLTEIITEIDNNATKLSTIETNICSIDVKLDENSTKTTEIGDKIDELSTNLSEITTKSNTINEKVENIDSNVETIVTQTENLTTMNNNIITINSNTATTNNNVSTIKTNVEKITNSLPSGNYNNEVIQKLDEILKTVKQNANEETFTEDPYKLDMEYTERLEENRNPTNKIHVEFNKEFSSDRYTYGIAGYCAGDTINLKAEIKYTSESDKRIYVGASPRSFAVSLYAGTNTLVIEKNDLEISNNRFCFSFEFGEITIHSISIDIEGEKVYIPPKKKYKINHSVDKIVITKVEDNNGYYLVLDKKEALHPSMLKENFTLARQNVLDYDMTYDFTNHKNKFRSLDTFELYIPFNRKLNYCCAGEYRNLVANYNFHSCSFGYADLNYIYAATPYYTAGNLYLMKFHTGITQTYLNNTYIDFQKKYISNATMVCDINIFDYSDRKVFLVECVDGTNYLYINESCYLDVGFGKFATGFFDVNNSSKINVYMNDNGYCVKKVCLVNDDKTEITLISQRIIGTYDVYHETNSNVYFVEKNGELFMFKKNESV